MVTVTVQAKYGEHLLQLPVHVIDGDGPNLLGRDLAQFGGPRQIRSSAKQTFPGIQGLTPQLLPSYTLRLGSPYCTSYEAKWKC